MPKFALSVFACLAVVGVTRLDAQSPPPVEARLESCRSGTPVLLSSFRGRVGVIFYEDREHTGDNERLKLVLVRFIRDNGLSSALTMIPIANASGYQFASGLVRAGLAQVSARIHLDILIDWHRTLGRAPFGLRDGASNVVVLDRSGRIAFRHIGVVGAPQETELFRAIRGALRAAP